MGMDKKEILARAQEEQMDDGAVEAEHRGQSAGLVAFSVVFLLIIGVSVLAGGGPQFEVCAMYTAFLAAQAFPLWKFSRRRIHLAGMIVDGIATLVFLALFLSDTLGIDL